MANLSGWIIHKQELGENFEVERLVEEFQKQSVNIRVVNPQDVDIFVDRDDRKSIIVKGKPRQLPDFVLPRTGSGTTYFIKAIIRHMERLGVTMINGSESIDAVKDKLYSQQILGQSNLPVPKTMLVRHPINLELIEKNLSYPIIVKTLSGSYGAGVFLVEDRKQFRQLMKMAELTKPSYNIIVQEFIKESWGKDLRVFILNGKVVGCMMRQSTDDDFRANITRGGEGIPYQIDAKCHLAFGSRFYWIRISTLVLDYLLLLSESFLVFQGQFGSFCQINSVWQHSIVPDYCLHIESRYPLSRLLVST